MQNSSKNENFDFEQARRAISINESFGDITLSIYLNDVFVETKKNTWHTEWHKHSFSELIVLFSGEEYIEFENETDILLKPHDICIIPAKTIHKSTPVSQNQRWMSFLIDITSNQNNLRKKSLYNIFSPLKSTSESSCISIKNPTAYNIIDGILPTLESNDPLKELLLKYQILHFIVQCIRLIYMQSDAKKNLLNTKIPVFCKDSEEIQFQQVESFITNNYSSCTIEDLAKYINRSVRQTERIVTQHYGTTFKDIIIYQRIFSAQKLLLQGKKINFVSDYVGYNSLDGFRKAFKKASGFTPKEFVNKYVVQKTPFSFSNNIICSTDHIPRKKRTERSP